MSCLWPCSHWFPAAAGSTFRLHCWPHRSLGDASSRDSLPVARRVEVAPPAAPEETRTCASGS